MALASVGPYRVLERLGAGANGEVCLAEDTRLQRRVALKTCSGTAGADATDLRRRLLREARAAARLNHPHIAAVYDVIESDDGVHIVMEYVRGTTLATRIRQGPATPMQVLDIALQLSDALVHAHSLGVIHRDLKPANIIASSDGATKILDFGLARLCEVDAGSVPLSASDLSVDARHVVGTPPYIPPEHLSGAPVDARGDLYSLGVTLFELLTGRRPFEASNGMGLTQAILNAPTPRARTLCPECPAALDAIVYRSMSRNPSDRYASASELASDLKRLSAGITDVPTQSRAWPLVGTENRRRLAWVAASAVAGAIAVYAAVGPNRFRGDPSLAAGPKVVAVLPLAGASGDPQSESLAAGVADTLIARLSRVPGLTVVSREATLKYRDRKVEPNAIARELGATLLVDGSLDRSGDRAQIRLGVVQPGEKATLWQDTYAGDYSEMPSVRRGVARAVANAFSLPDPRAAEDARPSQNDEAWADYAKARTFLERADLKDSLDLSIGLFKSAIARDARFAGAHAGLGVAYWRKYQATRDDKWSVEALAAIHKALTLDPQDASVRLASAAIYRGRGDMKEAAEELTTVINSWPESDEAHRQLGLVLMSLGDPERGIAEIQKAIRLRPEYWGHHGNLGTAYYNLGRYTEAAASFKRVTELQPDSPWGYSMLGSALHAMDDTATAVKMYEKAITLGSALAYSNLGALQYELGRYGEAARNYAEAVKRDPGSPLLHLNLGDVNARLGRDAEARLEYRRALDLNQAQVRVNPADTRALARLAVIESKVGRAKEADEHIAQAVAKDPKTADILFYQVVIHVRAGRLDQAVQALGNAFEHGYSRKRANNDPDLMPLQRLAGYQALIAGVAKGGAS